MPPKQRVKIQPLQSSYTPEHTLPQTNRPQKQPQRKYVGEELGEREHVGVELGERERMLGWCWVRKYVGVVLGERAREYVDV